jgi:hypothetical protein
LPWKFSGGRHNFWDNIGNLRIFFDWAAQQLNIKQFGDWYQVAKKVNNYVITGNAQDILQIDGSEVLFMGGKSLPQILAAVYPDYKWEPYRFTRVSSKYWEGLFQGRAIPRIFLISKIPRKRENI